MKSTMGAPLNDDEQARIHWAWLSFFDALEGKRAVYDTIEMLTEMAEIIGRGHAFQRTVHECWSEANRRAFPGPHAAPSARKVMSDLESLGLSADDVLAAINIIRTQESPK